MKPSNHEHVFVNAINEGQFAITPDGILTRHFSYSDSSHKKTKGYPRIASSIGRDGYLFTVLTITFELTVS